MDRSHLLKRTSSRIIKVYLVNGNRYNSRLIEIPCSEYYNVDRQRHIHSGTVSAMIAPENLQTDKNVTKDPKTGIYD